jgi:putative ABC transport system permease protein
MLHLILQSLRSRRIQTIAVILSVAVSITAFVALFLLYGGIQRGVALAEERSGAEVLVVPWRAADYVSDTDLLFTGAPAPVYMDAMVAERIAAIDGVGQVAVQFYGQSLAESCCSTNTEVRVIGIDSSSDWLIGSYTDYDLAEGLGEDELIIGCNVLGFEQGSGSLLGNTMRVAAQLEPSGRELDSAILMDIDRLRQMVADTPELQHFWEGYGEPSGLISAVLFNFEPDAEPYLVKNKVEAVGARAIERSETVAETSRQLSVVFLIMLAAGITLTVASILQFMARFYSLVWERKAEMALYRALGATRRALRTVIGGEAFAITAAGALVGMVLGVLLYQLLLQMMQEAGAFPFLAFSPGVAALGIAAIALVFFVFAVLAIIMPLRQVGRIDPAAAMQQVDIG